MQGKSPHKSDHFIINRDRDFLSKIVHLLWFLVKNHSKCTVVHLLVVIYWMY